MLAYYAPALIPKGRTTLASFLKSQGYRTAGFGKWHLGPDGHGFDINDTNGLGADLSKKYYNDENATRTLTFLWTPWSLLVSIVIVVVTIVFFSILIPHLSGSYILGQRMGWFSGGGGGA